MRPRTKTSLWVGGLVSAAIVFRLVIGRSRRLFARSYARRARRAERGEIGRRRHSLLAHASGRVLDLGAGTGESFQHVPPSVSALVAVEPDPAMLHRGRRRTADTDVPVRFVRGLGDALPFADACFDTAVAALVLCTVDDLDATLAELARVLRPGGRLLLMEHVRAADEDLARLQDLVERPWRWFNGGCRPNRDTLAAVEAAGFLLASTDGYGYPILPHVVGVAIRR